jgi:hypothetical protein
MLSYVWEQLELNHVKTVLLIVFLFLILLFLLMVVILLHILDIISLYHHVKEMPSNMFLYMLQLYYVSD